VHDTSVERGFEMDRVINEAMRQTRVAESDTSKEEAE
jgi:hypothetical protein